MDMDVWESFIKVAKTILLAIIVLAIVTGFTAGWLLTK